MLFENMFIREMQDKLLPDLRDYFLTTPMTTAVNYLRDMHAALFALF